MCSKHSLRWTSEHYWTRGMWKSGLSKSKGLRGGLGSFEALCRSLKSPVPMFMGIPIIMHSDTPVETQDERLAFSLVIQKWATCIERTPERCYGYRTVNHHNFRSGSCVVHTTNDRVVPPETSQCVRGHKINNKVRIYHK